MSAADAVRFTLVDANGNPGSTTRTPHDALRMTMVDALGNVIDPTDILNDSLMTPVGQDVVSLGSNWDMVITSAAQIDTASMGTLKALGTPSNATELEYDATNTPVIVNSDGSFICNTATPVPTSSNGATASANASTLRAISGAWANPQNAVGASDTSRAVFTSANPGDIGLLDLGFSIPALPAGAAVFNVVVAVSGFASADATFPYTIELIDVNGAHIGSAAQSANNGSPFTFTGITAAQIPTMGARIRAVHANNTTSATVNIDSVSIVVNYATAASLTYHYRCEMIYTSDRIDGSNDYTNFRFTEGKRIRVAFEVLTHNMNAQSADNWNSIFQALGPAGNGSYPFAPISIQVINGTWRLQHGQGIDVGSMTTHEDERWVRWELDILLGRAGVGTVKAWKDGISLGTWTPTAGTFPAGTGNTGVDLQWIYFKNGLYGGATTSPQLPAAVFRNRRFTVSNPDGSSATTWRSPQSSSNGMHIFKRNPTTDLPY